MKPIRFDRSIFYRVLIFGILLPPAAAIAGQRAPEYGPETKSFLEYIRHELDELDFQIKHNEISRKDYVHNKNRIEVHRQAVLEHVRKTGQDVVPEYSVASEAELGDFLPNGIADLKGHKPGDQIDSKWRFAGVALRSEKFYILERIAGY